METFFCFQAIRSCQLDINGLPVLCQELLRHWSKVVAFLSKSTPTQEGTGVRKQVRVLWLLRPTVQCSISTECFISAQSLEWSLVYDDFFPSRLELFYRLVQDC